MQALYLVRHGEPEGAGRLLGSSDPPLTPHGREQMRGVRAPAARWFASTLRRSYESAELCPDAQSVVRMPELSEISLGAWNGLTWAEIEARWPELAAAKLRDWFGVTPPGGESWTGFTARVDRALDAITRLREDVAVVAHLTVNSWIAHRLAGVDPLGFEQQYAQVYRYAF